MPWDSIVNGCLKGTNADVATLACIPALFSNVINALFAFSGTVAVFIIIFSGIKFITSGGDAKQVEGARKTLTYAVIGLIVVLIAYFIINIVSYVTGVTCIRQFGFNTCK